MRGGAIAAVAATVLLASAAVGAAAAACSAAARCEGPDGWGLAEVESEQMRAELVQTRARVLGSRSGGPGTRQPLSTTGADGGPWRIVKHTYSSNDGEGDYAFINKYFCAANTDSAPLTCAVDVKAPCDGFEVHMVQSYVTKNGSETPNEWFSYMRALHGDMTSWDQFMHHGTTFYANDLSDHLETFQADGVPFMARKTSSSTTLYSLLVQTPSAKVMEIVSAKAPRSFASLFVEWKNDECPISHERSLLEIEALNGGSEQSRRGGQSSVLPTLTAIGINVAASAQTVNEIGAWLEKYGISGYASSLQNGSSCAVASIAYSNGEVRYVSNPGARVGSKTIEQYEEMQMVAHEQYIGNGTGWDAWMDNHWCIGTNRYGQSLHMYLDSIAKMWADDGVGWRASNSKVYGALRSVGLRGETIELNGLIDGSFLQNVGGFDFCTADAVEPDDGSLSSAAIADGGSRRWQR